jgi:outer membrane protein TolC
MCFASVVYAADDALTLAECYRLALAQSETLAIQKERIAESEGAALQALGTALPKVSFVHIESVQDKSGERAVRDKVPEDRFAFTQPLFTGFKEFAALSGSKHLGKQREAELTRARQLLYIDVSDAFYLALRYQRDEEVVLAMRTVLVDRLGELTKRQALGKSRPSEVASAQAKLSRLDATLEGVMADRAVVGQVLTYLIGRTFGVLRDDAFAPAAYDRVSVIEMAAKRADVEAAREAYEVSMRNLTVVGAPLLPSAALTGSSYVKRGDAKEGNDWDAMLTVTVPIFNGTVDYGALKSARAQREQAALTLRSVRRKAELEASNGMVRWQAHERRAAALAKAVASAEENYRLQEEDFKTNLVSNLDVLSALEDLQGARRDLVAAETDARRAYCALLAYVGEV